MCRGRPSGSMHESYRAGGRIGRTNAHKKTRLYRTTGRNSESAVRKNHAEAARSGSNRKPVKFKRWTSIPIVASPA